MKYLVMFYCLFFVTSSYSQSIKNSITVLQEFFADKLPITYSDTVHQYDLKYLKSALIKDTLNSNFFFGKKDNSKQLILTKDEKKYLLGKIDEQQGFIWPHSLFKGDQKSLVEQKNSTSKFKNFFQSIYSFSKPIFIRNDTICIFYYGYYCGGECGKGSIEIYHKINEKWTTWISIIQWIS
ncbi:MAG: hypothetical protein EOP42_09455 [Sphingobacteriaceae bacterium]|nr:MAG: hypothetical protein EOP42_09455 [Sphingobacteriaceae bacterium]